MTARSFKKCCVSNGMDETEKNTILVKDGNHDELDTGDFHPDKPT